MGSTGVALSAEVNPAGAATAYRFEYGATGAYGLSTTQASLGSIAYGDVNARASLSGLQPDTTYHVTVVASNENGTTTGADLTFTTFPPAAPGLPDGRGYEMVSPAEDADGNVYEPSALAANGNGGNGDNTERPFQAAADGKAMAYTGDPAATSGTGSEGAGAGNQYLAIRAPGGGWKASDIEPASGYAAEDAVYQAFSSDLSVSVFDWNGRSALTPGAPAGGYHVLYTRSSGDGGYHPLFTTTPPNRNSAEFGSHEVFHLGEGGVVYAGSSSNLEHMLFVANDALTANALGGGETENNLYDSIGGQLHLVNVLPDGTSHPNAIFGSPTVEPEEEARGDSPDFSHVISSDGSRIFWTDLSSGDLYVRENGATTVQVDAAVGGGGRFWAASADGSKVFFTKGDLYEYDLDSGQLSDLAPGGEVQGVVGASEDGSYVYFVAKGALAPGAAPQACEPNSPETDCNLYLLHVGESPKLIAVLAGADDRARALTLNGRVYGDWRPGLGNRTAAVTPDGRHLVFLSRRSLTGYENDDESEVYVYDADANHLSCASCNSSGEPPRPFTLSHEYAAYLPPSYSNTYLPRWISEDGSRVFFDSIEALVPQDTNGKLDVYEWEREGAGSCLHSGGCTYLLSGGTSTDNSYLADASASGDDVFFVTRAQLAPADGNENFDVYDARVGASTPSSATSCADAGCQSAPPPPPAFAAPSSMTFSGAGNLAPAAKASAKPRRKATTCRKGTVRKRGRCVKHKKKKAKKSSKGRK